MLRRTFDNPVLLRDLGWKYYPPVFGRIPRLWVHLGVGTVLFATPPALAILLEIHAPRSAGPLILFAFALLGWSLILLRSILTALFAWRRERELHVLDELILTGMTPADFASARIFARGFPFVAGSLLLGVMGFAGVLWLCLMEKNLLDEGILYAVGISGAVCLLIPLFITHFYLRLLRIGLRRGFALFRLARSVLWWGILFPLLLLVPVFALVFVQRLVNPRDRLLIEYFLYAALCVPAFAMMVVVAYRNLLYDIERFYLQDAEEAVPAASKRAAKKISSAAAGA